ncbi:hypothetical protein Pla123a_08890 [Posidoniimonas polymericola]|uniref:Transcobalamin-like C-terminal domain-containing protein n=1 Tax=Posidoniimonas polymericola TaxID=2528002 RepID=A0A5C5YTI8_9BACT|nr:DUF4430 domain-containing protein [Posidoniimonas polymericola]TWT78100.1 hypothetical protein Pla123a_08890 [Posidoniimonas polymericola]
MASPARGWAFPLLLMAVLGAVVLWNTIRSSPNVKPAPTNGPVEGEVVVELNVEGQPPLERAVPPVGGNALSALQAAGEASDAFRPDVSGSGSSAFVEAVGGVGNEGFGGRNWTFEVNGRPADRSAAITPVKDGDRVLWKFAPPE